MNLQDIKKLNPCEDGWKNLIKHYPEWSGTLLGFMDLNNIPDKDKVWLFSHADISDHVKREFGFICAEIAMQYTDKEDIYEFHILNLIHYESGEADSAADSAARSAADSAANSAAYYAARSAARSAARCNQVDIIKNLLEEISIQIQG